MLPHIAQGVAFEAWFWHIVLIGFPGAPAGFDQVGQAGRVDVAVVEIDAVIGDVEGVAADQGDVIWQAGMCCRIMLGQQGV